MPWDPKELDDLLDATSWQELDALVAQHPFVLERPFGQAHPQHPDIIYPLDYGHLAGTTGLDGEEVDAILGSLPEAGLVGVIATADFRRGDRELKLLLGCTPTEVYTALGFFNFDPNLMRGRLRLREAMTQLWALQAQHDAHKH